MQKTAVLCIGLLVLSVTLFAACAKENAGRITEVVSSESGFRHPGILQSKAMLDAMCLSLKRGEDVRVQAWQDMLDHPRGNLGRDSWQAPSEIVGWDNLHFKTAAAIANSYALRWIVNGKAEDAEKAIQIINHWSSTLTSVRSKLDDVHDHKRLIMGIHSGYWAQAGELLRYSGAPWTEAEQKQFERWLREVILPAMNPRPNTYNGNWDAAITWSTLAIAVFLDDRALFDENIERLKSGETNARLTHYLLPNGQCQETGRDQDHAQMGLGFLSRACEIAWNQGIDLYDFENVSIGKSFEYCARYNLGDDNVPFKGYPTPVGEEGNDHDGATEPSAIKRGIFHPMYEMVYHHYHHRRNVPMPYVRKALEHTRIEHPDRACDYWNTFCFANLQEE